MYVKKKHQSRIWYFQDAVLHMKEVMRRAYLEGPQTVRLYGKKAVVFRPVDKPDQAMLRRLWRR